MKPEERRKRRATMIVEDYIDEYGGDMDQLEAMINNALRDARNEALEAAAVEADTLADAYSNEDGCYIAEAVAGRIRALKTDQAP